MAIGARVFLGLTNPTVGLIKTVVSELCAQKDQVRCCVCIYIYIYIQL
jgi:hypothetical protein